MTTVVYPGSFNPLHRGHISVITQCLELFDKTIILVAQNNQKPQDPNEVTERRVKAIEADILNIQEQFDIEVNPSNIEVVVLNGSIADYLKDNQIEYVVRGVRNNIDFNNELNYVDIIDTLLKNDDYYICPVILTAQDKYRNFSSTAVRSILACEGWTKELHKFVPRNTFKHIVNENRYVSVKDWFYSACKDLLGVAYNDKRNVCLNTFEDKIFANYLREYHNFDHLINVLCDLNEFYLDSYGKLPDSSVIMAAIWHDYYINYQGDNSELESANECAKFLKSVGVKDYLVDNISTNILSTKFYKNTEFSPPLRDADLSILGKDRNTYKNYMLYVEAECLSQGISRVDFLEGRFSFLKDALNMKLFNTEYFYNKYEQVAKNNICWELDQRTYNG